jgi:ADP-ribose pyrophosphatase
MIEILNQKTHYTGKAFNVDRVNFRMPNGKEPTYDLVVHPGAAVVMPIDPEGNILFVKQFRLGSQCELLELPAGTLEAGEPPSECAAREVREETGYAAAELTLIGEFWLTPGYSNEYLYIYLAQELSPAPLTQDEDELIELVPIPLEQAYQMAARGLIQDGKTLAALFLASAGMYGNDADEDEDVE